jgi:hypothetical protein
VVCANSDAISTVSRMVEYLNYGAHGYQVESVAFDSDLKAKVTCVQFEVVCKDLHQRFARPIHNALVMLGFHRYSLSCTILEILPDARIREYFICYKGLPRCAARLIHYLLI